MRWAALIIFALMLGAENIAFADCTPASNLVAPHQRATWVEGGLVYDTTADTLKTCDGTNYTEITSGSGASALDDLSDATKDTTNNNLWVGVEMGTLGNNNFNTSVGIGALDALSNSAGASEGDYNTAIGYVALSANTTGYSNTASGVNALFLNTTGYQNTATGVNALIANTTGYNNTANGVAALRFNTSGYNNTAQGVNALFGNTTGYHNTGLGMQTLIYNTTGSQNVVVGLNAGYGVSGSTVVSYSVLLGNRAGAAVTTAEDNVMVGYEAGDAVTTGDDNTLLGTQAGDNITTGSSNIIIGSGVDAPVATSSNQLNIGNTIYGDLSTGYVGIGTTAPQQLLHINNAAGASLSEAQFTNGSTGGLSTDGLHIGIDTDNHAMLWSKDLNDIKIGTSNIERLRITHAGNVGIGTENPGAVLDMASDSGSLRLTDVDTSLSDGEMSSDIEFANSDSDAPGGVSARIRALGKGSVGYTSLAFQVGQAGGTLTDAMHIDGTSGNVGIGTTNPLYKLHVVGGSTLISESTVGINLNTTTSAANNGLTIAQYGTGDANLSFLLPSVRRWNIGVDNSDGDKLKIMSDNSNDYSGSGLVIDTSGNVGIGTSAPSVALEISTTSAVGLNFPNVSQIQWDTDASIYGSSNQLVFRTNSNQERMRIGSSGNVGIGTADPSSTLHVPDGKYAQFSDVNAGAPLAADCDNDNERGRQSLDSTNFRLYICMGAARGWDYVALTN